MCRDNGKVFDFDLESQRAFLSCAISDLFLIQTVMGQNLIAQAEGQNPHALSMLDQCCEAMTPVIHELDRIQEEMDTAINAAYKKRKEDLK